MSHDVHHEHLLQEITEQLQPIFSNSPQAIYLYLDDEHKICNQRFSDLLEYDSIEDWVKNDYPVGDVLEEDQEKVILAYQQASEDFTASSHHVRVRTKKGKEIEVSLLMTPLPYKGEVFVLHFISEKHN